MPQSKRGLILFASLLVGGCYTPPDFVTAATEDSDAVEADAEPVTIASRGQRGVPEAAAAADPLAGPGTITYKPPFDGTPLATQDLGEGLILDDFVVGEGAETIKGGMITVHYTGYLRNGAVFDDSTARNVPASFTIGTGGVIKGWDRGLMGMKVGGKRRLTVPAALAYGPKGRGKIPADSDLVFTVELLAVSGAPKSADTYAGAGQSKETRDDGLVITIYEKGTGPKADLGDEIYVHYTGKLADGTVFDTSIERGQPLRMPLGKGIKGWNEGIIGMQVGGRRKIMVPAALGYGEKDMGKIPPNSDLTFFVEMMALNKRPEPVTPPPG